MEQAWQYEKEGMALQYQYGQQAADNEYARNLRMWKATNYGAQTKEMEAAGLSKGLMYGGGGGQAASTAGGDGMQPSGVFKNGVPLLLYLDIFKNYFANTQENKFYMLKGAGNITLNISDTYQSSDDGYYKIGTDQYSVHFTKTTTIETTIATNDYQRFWDSIKVRVILSDGSFQTTNLGKLTTNALTKKIILNAVSAEPYATILQFQTTQAAASFIKTELGQYDLKVLDEIRDVILHKKGNETLVLDSQNIKAN